MRSNYFLLSANLSLEGGRFSFRGAEGMGQLGRELVFVGSFIRGERSVQCRSTPIY